MLPFGHMGLGVELIKNIPIKNLKKLPFIPILIGTITPDIIDKTLYYSMVQITGKWGAEVGLVSGTQTFTHTLLCLVFIFILSFLLKARFLFALGFGVGTHILLDVLTGESFDALLFPFLGFNFPAIPYADTGEHLGSFRLRPFILWLELLGAVLVLRRSSR